MFGQIITNCSLQTLPFMCNVSLFHFPLHKFAKDKNQTVHKTQFQTHVQIMWMKYHYLSKPGTRVGPNTRCIANKLLWESWTHKCQPFNIDATGISIRSFKMVITLLFITHTILLRRTNAESFLATFAWLSCSFSSWFLVSSFFFPSLFNV